MFNNKKFFCLQSPSKVHVAIDSLHLPCSTKCESFLEMKYKKNMISTGPRFCCGEPPHSFVSDGYNFVLIYKSDGTNQTQAYRGFELRFREYREPISDSISKDLSHSPANSTGKSPTRATRITNDPVSSSSLPPTDQTESLIGETTWHSTKNTSN
ncbi:hypothetical protein AB6A40_005406 [Gnathostoma spinigerum]|uniref:CUB domain-containing protein n=1 Tax=Gnathostoma spinigerum TaxID=75299 RepID=A0ABD6EQ69_9BILA